MCPPGCLPERFADDIGIAAADKIKRRLVDLENRSLRVEQTNKLVGGIENGTKATLALLKLVSRPQTLRNITLNDQESGESAALIGDGGGRALHIDDAAILADKVDIRPVVTALPQNGKVAVTGVLRIRGEKFLDILADDFATGVTGGCE